MLPEAVYEELISNQDFLEEAEQVKSCEFFKKVFVGDSQAVGMLMRVTGLDLGESEVIVYSDENKSDLLIVDEVRARHIATMMKLRITGTIGRLCKFLSVKSIIHEKGPSMAYKQKVELPLPIFGFATN